MLVAIAVWLTSMPYALLFTYGTAIAVTDRWNVRSASAEWYTAAVARTQAAAGWMRCERRASALHSSASPRRNASNDETTNLSNQARQNLCHFYGNGIRTFPPGHIPPRQSSLDNFPFLFTWWKTFPSSATTICQSVCQSINLTRD